MTNKIRTFIAVPLPGEVREKIYRSIEPLRQLSLNIKWVEPENYHLTLKFFGDLARREIETAGEVLSKVTAATDPLELHCGGWGAFPNRERPRVLWLDLSGEAERLQDLWRRLEEELQTVGFPPSAKRFQPHLTLGRLRRPNSSLNLTPEQWRGITIPKQGGAFTVTEINLMASRLTSAGPHYTPIKVCRCRII